MLSKQRANVDYASAKAVAADRVAAMRAANPLGPPAEYFSNHLTEAVTAAMMVMAATTPETAAQLLVDSMIGAIRYQYGDAIAHYATARLDEPLN